VLSIAILVAFMLGFLARRVGLPPLVGFLVGGFVLHAIGEDGGEALPKFGEIGVYLLLFSIGLKLRPKSLLRPEIWAVASVHMAVVVVLFGAAIYALGMMGFSLFATMGFDTALLLAFALSFSSTVFAVKVLAETGQSQSLFGRTAIGILIVQDIFAVAFMTASAGKLPNAWALLLLGFPLYRWIILRFMTMAGHAELLVLLGVTLAVSSADVFVWMGLKPDIAPLLIGVVVGQHPKAKEMARTLTGFQDLFLMLFFLTIGLNGFPTLEGLGIALLLVALMPLKTALFFGLLTRFNMRARTSVFTSLSLANYSEFGLIVGAVGAASGWLSDDWLVIIAIALSITFVLASPLNSGAMGLYGRIQAFVGRFETDRRLDEELPIDPGDSTVVVIGMGRIGTGVFDALKELRGDTIVGLDYNIDVVQAHRAAGRRVVEGDPTDPEFVARLNDDDQMELVVLATGELQTSLATLQALGHRTRNRRIAATASWPEDADALREAGADLIFRVYADAGSDYARRIQEELFASDGTG
jgi:glutathione-regulated potassium-efflux system ancillary protein KefC